MKKLHKSFDGLSISMTKELARINKCHKIWHQFSGWLVRTYGDVCKRTCILIIYSGLAFYVLQKVNIFKSFIYK